MGKDGSVGDRGMIMLAPLVDAKWTGAAGDGDQDNPGNWEGGRLPPRLVEVNLDAMLNCGAQQQSE